MKIYKVKVNGKLYEVELEAVSENNASIASEAKTPVAAAPISGNSTVVPAPITGKVVALKVNVGDTVKKGQCLLLIEAMKLENEVVSPVDGKVVAIKVNVGASVNTKDELVILG